MANIPISALPNVQPSGYTPNDLLVIVNNGVTKNTSLFDISSYVFSSFTGNTSATCITDLYVTNLYGCSPINVNDSLIMATGTSISSSNGTAKIELDSGGNPDILFISTSSNDTYLQLDSNIEFISNNGYFYSYAANSITQESDGTIENIVYGNGGSPNIKWKMDSGTGGNPGLFYLSNSGNYNQNGEFISIGYDFTYGGYLKMGSKTGTNSLLTLESNKSGLYFDDSAPLSPYSPSRPYALFNSKNTIDIFTDRVSTLTEGDFSLRVVNQDNFKKSGLYAGYLNSVELASNDKSVFFSRDNSSVGYYGFNGVSAGGAGGTVLIGTGSLSYIESGITNTVVIGGDNIFADTSDTVYVPNLNIGTIGSNPSVINLGLDSNGFVVTGQTGFTGGTVAGETTFTGGLSATTFSATTIDLCATNGTLYTDSISGCSPINFLSESNFVSGLTATTISATTYENLPVSGVTSTGTGVSLISAIVDGDVKVKSINGNSLVKISADTISDTVELDVVEPNLDLWNLIIPNGNRLLYGDVSYVSGLTFDVGPCKYIIENNYYYAPLTTITLSSGSTDDRIDVIYADTNGTIGVLSGDPSTNPVKPNVDNTTQCEISFVNVSASATSLNPNQFVIFDEDTGPPSEWDFLTGGPQSTKIVIDNTIGYTGTTSVRASGITYNVTPTFFRLSGTSVVDTNNYATIQFAMRNLSANNVNTVIRFRFLDSNLTTNGVQIGMDAATTATNPIKYSATNVSGWQLISIPLWRFQLSNTNVSLFEVSFSTPNIVGVQARYYFDYFRFVAGSSSSPPSNSWTVIQGDSTATMSAPSPNATLRISGGTNIGSTLFSSLNPRTIRIDLDNNISLSGITASTIYASNNVGIGTSSPTKKLQVNGDGLFSSSTNSVLTVVGSGSSTTPPLFKVQGSSGELFSVSDSLTGSLFSVNDISGLPVLEVFSDNTILMGDYSLPMLTTTKTSGLGLGLTTIYSLPTSAYTGAFFDYVVSDGTNLRAGNIMSAWDGVSATYLDTPTGDIGITTGITFNVSVSGGNAILKSSGTTTGWTVKTIIRSI